MKKYNFSAGPAILPESVIQKAAAAVTELDGIGLSLIEISHRSPEFQAVMDKSVALVKEILALDDDFEVLFLQGGASTQFFHIPANILNKDETAAYIDTGSWANKAAKEAKHYGNVDVVASSKESTYNYIPKDFNIAEGTKYLHVTSNNTIYGTQYHNFPKGDFLKVVDMSSDIFCRKLDANQFDLIYAGAQKNLGPAGTTLVIVRKSILGKIEHAIPTMVNYQTHIDKGSMFNTPPVFAVYTCMLTLEWIKELGGLEAIETINRRKAQKLYDAVDASELFEGTAAKEDRSLMNVTFVMKDKSREADFLKFATERGCSGIKGHRSVGGFRASIYNACPETHVDHLINVINEFEKA